MKNFFLLISIICSMSLYGQNPKNSDLPYFHELTKTGNKVFLECDVPNSLIHASNYLNKWGYWNIVTKKEDANFVLKFTLVLAWPDYIGFAQFIDPKSNEILKETKRVNTIMSMDFNTKRGVIKKIILKGIKPLYY